MGAWTYVEINWDGDEFKMKVRDVWSASQNFTGRA